MNWLAHVFLSENHIEHQLGNLLTDPLKGKAWEGATERHHRGIMMHKYIDTFTDKHPLVSLSKSTLTPRGHLKGVVLDILYDHFLSLHWDRYSTIPREVFIEDFRFRAMREMEKAHYPSRAKNVISRVVGSRQLSSYAHMHGVVDAFRRIDARLSDRARSKDSCARYIPLIAAHREVLEAHFLQFFPQLMYRVSQKCLRQDVSHWRL
jgi:acyl carrier protein phosphodiesterase